MLLEELLMKGRLLRRQDKSAAIATFEQCIQQAKDEDNQSVLALALLEVALDLIETAQDSALDRAKDLLLQAEPLLAAGSDSDLAYLFYCRGILDLQQGNLNDALMHLQSAYQTYSEDTESLSLVDDALGRYYATIGDSGTAALHLKRSLSRRQEPESEQAKAISFIHLGRLNLKMDNYDQADNFFQKSLDMALQWSDVYTRAEALTGLGQVAIARAEWQIAATFFQDALLLMQSPPDLIKAAYLYANLAEALLGEGKIEEAQNYVELDAMPRFEALQDQRGLATVKHVMGRISLARLERGRDTVNEESIATAEDQLLEASMLFEQSGMLQDYVKTLYDMAILYHLCSNSGYKYQYQGKSIRCLEMALSVLEQFGEGQEKLTNQVETLLNQLIGTIG